MSSRKKSRKKRKVAKRPSPDNPPETRDKRRDGSRQPAGGSGVAGVPEAKKIQRLISKGQYKAAVNRAKQIHKRLGTDASEQILVDAYMARIGDMTANGYTVEAKALLGLVRERFKCAEQRVSELSASIALHEGHIDTLTMPLNDPDLPAAERSVIEKTIRNELVDLNLLVRSEALSPHHPLKIGAAAVTKALAEVTSGAVADAAIALPAISRRSPLAPWKMLVKAIAGFYRQDDDKCEKYLQAIDPDSVPARLVPAIREMISGKATTSPLVENVVGSEQKLHNALQLLDNTLAAGKPRKLSRSVRPVMDICKKMCPEICDRLGQHISIRAWMGDMDVEMTTGALGGPALKNAYFWMLFARAAEIKGQAFFACALWAEFRKHALHEGWFSDNTPEVALIYLHMANLLQRLPTKSFERLEEHFKLRFQGFESYYHEQSASVAAAARNRGTSTDEMYFMDPDSLFRLASDIDPVAQTFKAWLAWVERDRPHWKMSDPVALAWHGAIPDDPEPLLVLMKSAEKRNAYKKALGFLEKAERLDSLNPNVKRARLRLLTSTAIRHLKQKKTHLVEKDIADMERLPQAVDDDRPAFVLALKSACAIIDKKKTKQIHLNGELAECFPYQLTAQMVVQGVIAAGGQSHQTPRFPSNSPLPVMDDDLVAAIARGCKIGEDMGVAVAVPERFEKTLINFFANTESARDVAALRIIADAALGDEKAELAYAAAGAGLLRNGPHTARFLLLRARSMPIWERERREGCLAAAITLARRERDVHLIDEAVEIRRNGNGSLLRFPLFMDVMKEDNADMDAEDLAEVLVFEKEAREYPIFIQGDPFDGGDDDDGDDLDHDCRHCDAVDCPDRRAPFMPDEWDDEDDDLDEFIDEMVDEYLPEVIELAKKDPGLAEKIMAGMLKGEVKGSNPGARRKRNRPHVHDVVDKSRPDTPRQRQLPFDW